MTYMKGNMLITGGAGFIGSNAAAYFAGKGYQVTFLDNLSRNGSETNKAWLESLQLPNINFVKADITDAQSINELLKNTCFDVVLHCAAQVAVTTSVADPLLDHEINVRGTLNLLEAVRNGQNPQAAFLFTSTNKVYGEMEAVELAEEATRYSYKEMKGGVAETLPLDFHSPYGCSKGAADQYVRDYARIYGMHTVVFRQSCIYGGHQFGMVDQGWVAFLTMQALFGKQITIYGDGKQVRDILFVSDLLRAMEIAIENPDKSKGEIFNMGGGPQNTSSLLEFISFLEKRFDKKIPLQFGDWRPGDQKVYVSDISKANNNLGWKPKIALEEGFEEMLRFIEDNKPVLEKLV
jgi:CDP-paratose 2-epimerase